MAVVNEDLMREAIAEVEVAVKDGNAPFGVVVIDSSSQIVWRDHDRVKELMDPTAHGEVNAIRGLCKELNTLHLSDSTFYTTSEPCQTCLSAMIKARVPKVVYGAKTGHSASLPIPAEELAKYAKLYPIEVIGGILENECLSQRNKYLSQ